MVCCRRTRRRAAAAVALLALLALSTATFALAQDDGEQAVDAPTGAKKAGDDDAVDAAPAAAAAAAAKEAPAAAAEKAAPAPAPAAAGGSSSSKDKKKGPAKKNKEVEIAPEAELANDIDDIDVENGWCVDFIKSSSCADVTPGEGAVAGCISDILSGADAGDADAAEAVPEPCREDVFNYLIKRAKNINANVPLARACKKDAEKLCNNSWLVGVSADGRVISCLRERKGELSKPCSAEVFKVQRAIADDYRADPAMAEACKADAARLCAGVKDGGGRVSACLQSNAAKLGWECAEEVMRQAAEADEDIRLDVRLFQTCLADKRRFCAEVPPGQSAARDCLVAMRHDPHFSEACRGRLEELLEQRVRDFRIDTRLRRACGQHMLDLCGAGDGYDDDATDMNVCLQDSVDLIPAGDCLDLVREYQALAAEDIRFDVPLADACHEDRKKLCAAVQPGSARVIRCLQNSRDKLSPICRAQLFDEEVRFSENIDFQYPMKQACEAEIERFCADVPHGNARVIRCLQESKDEEHFGKACLQEVESYEQQSAQDYRLNFRLRRQCSKDIKALCSDACKPNGDQLCGGTVLRCLTERRDELSSDACKAEVYYFEKMEVQNYHNDVILAAACRKDVDQFCKDVAPGDGRVHACLRSHRQQLSEACAREEALLEQQEAEHIELRPGLLKACADERSTFCRSVAPGSARVFRCLAEHLADPDFGAKCRYEVVTKLQRRQANWKLDPSLRRACKADVKELCDAADRRNAEAGEVYRCLVTNYDDLDPGCRKELGRAVHMAFFIWAPNAILTRPCDPDVQRVCLKDRPNMDRTPGAVGTCMAEVLERLQAAEAGSLPRKAIRDPVAATAAAPQLSDECRALADVAEPPNMKRAFETTLSVALLESQLSAIESRTGLDLVQRDRRGNARGVTLTGWTALAGIAALVVLVVVGAAFGYRKWRGVPDATTVVLKSRARYGRVATGE